MSLTDRAMRSVSAFAVTRTPTTSDSAVGSAPGAPRHLLDDAWAHAAVVLSEELTSRLRFRVWMACKVREGARESRSAGPGARANVLAACEMVHSGGALSDRSSSASTNMEDRS